MNEDYAYLAARVPPGGRRFIESALSGDLLAAAGLVGALGELRALQLGLLLFKERRAPLACRGLVQAAWALDSQKVLAVIELDRLAELFAFAGFSRPSGDVVQLWRGAAGTSVAETAAGLSWCTGYAFACTFAMNRSFRGGGAPMVVTAVVPSRDVVLFTRNALLGQDQEAVLFNPPENPKMAGSPAEWRRETMSLAFDSLLRAPEDILAGWKRFREYREPSVGGDA
ncbi:hypothetical protein HOP60_01290 [Halomonas daqingensis]|uniref:Uncharacterized protein n=1 Tax=Billgrantia desiderata TaxID=52021 RepID=A0ABS9B112_9GAMM|nr:hypothetical protein [Halomonas desiderata]MCE8040786.1 hypothetical protein [Halomonas desiderata]MCE8045361.1 hypothetical protein [Halomonas desiderata]